MWKFLKIKSKKKKQKRRLLKNVLPGDYIRVEWRIIEGGIGYLKCLNNDPRTKKIWLEVEWGNKEGKGRFETMVLNYYDYELRNFSLLNSSPISPRKGGEISELEKHEKELQEALEKEDYLKMREIQSKIDKLSKK